MITVGLARSACAIRETLLTVCSPVHVRLESSWTTALCATQGHLQCACSPLTQLHAQHVLQAAHAALTKALGGAPAAQLISKMECRHAQKCMQQGIKLSLPDTATMRFHAQRSCFPCCSVPM